jgi:cell division protein FtsL
MIKRKRARGIVFYALVAAGSAGVASLGQVWVHLREVELGYELGREKRALEELTQKNQRLRLEVDWLKSPSRVAELARRDLHMAAPDPDHLRLLPAARASIADPAGAARLAWVSR